ncbi:Hypothetical protein AA314_07159 [Archangium gephyra]|uniref:Uncharacterized protein n=1 Tax=Archangium gephyra TaxID=48 RepID=A0AAC8TGV8_9BACT|nr:Hypothetical protein AA314_07159 [Archangium gephyra]
MLDVLTPDEEHLRPIWRSAMQRHGRRGPLEALLHPEDGASSQRGDPRAGTGPQLEQPIQDHPEPGERLPRRAEPFSWPVVPGLARAQQLQQQRGAET